MKPDKITVDEFTTPNPEVVPCETSLRDVWQIMKDRGIRHVLVQNAEGQHKGILSERDVTTFSQSDYFEDIQAQDVMSPDIFTVTPDTPLFEVALKMSAEKIGSAIVQTDDSDEVGIFTATDALNALVEVLRGDLEE